MNIFFLHRKRNVSARWHHDSHVVKMILETAQLLCAVCWLNDIEAPYKLTHKKHPCTIWAGKTKANFNWLRVFGLRLCTEYTYRYEKIHKTQAVLEGLVCPDTVPDGPFSDPPQCMPDEYKHKKAYIAYRKYYLGEKRRNKAGRDLFKWTKRDAPRFVREALERESETE